jgi:hypothetical protein
MRSRRNVLIAFLCVLALAGLVSVPAEAAFAAQHGPSAGSPRLPLGARCETVRSSAHHHSGVICIGVVDRSAPRSTTAEITFRSNSGALKETSLAAMRLTVEGMVVEKIGPRQWNWKGPQGSVSFDKNWWDEPAGLKTQASVRNACLTWRDGARACTGSHWLTSKAVLG